MHAEVCIYNPASSPVRSLTPGPICGWPIPLGPNDAVPAQETSRGDLIVNQWTHRGQFWQFSIPDKIDFGLNLGFYNYSLYLSDLLIGVGFVTGITFTMHLWIVKCIDVLACWAKSDFKSGLLFLREEVIFSNLSFFLVFGRTLIPECAYRP